MRFILYLLLQYYTSYPPVSYIFVYLKYCRMSLCLFQSFKILSKISSYPASVRIERVKTRGFLSRICSLLSMGKRSSEQRIRI